jgi:hypothetical protein
MSIINPGDFPIDAQTVDGVELAARLNRLYGAIHSNNASTGRPPSVQAGGIWSRTNAQGIELMLFDGTNDLVIGAVANGVGTFGLSGDKIAPLHNPATSYVTGQVIWDPASGRFMTPINSAPAGQYNPAQWRPASSALEGLATPADLPLTITAGAYVATIDGTAAGTGTYTRFGPIVRAEGNRPRVMAGTGNTHTLVLPVPPPRPFTDAGQCTGVARNLFAEGMGRIFAKVGTVDATFDFPAPAASYTDVMIEVCYDLDFGG